MHATCGILLLFTSDALLLALNLSADSHIHRTKLISNCLHSATRASVMLSFCCDRASAASHYSVRFVCGLLVVCMLVLCLAITLLLSEVKQVSFFFQCIFVKPDNMKQLLVMLWICLSTSHSIVRNKLQIICNLVQKKN